MEDLDKFEHLGDCIEAISKAGRICEVDDDDGNYIRLELLVSLLKHEDADMKLTFIYSGDMEGYKQVLKGALGADMRTQLYVPSDGTIKDIVQRAKMFLNSQNIWVDGASVYLERHRMESGDKGLGHHHKIRTSIKAKSSVYIKVTNPRHHHWGDEDVFGPPGLRWPYQKSYGESHLSQGDIGTVSLEISGVAKKLQHLVTTISRIEAC